MKRFIVGSTWDRTNRNGINNNFNYLFEGVATMNDLNIKADATLVKADAVLFKSKVTLTEAERVLSQNADVQNQIDNLILESGTSDAEVVQARLAGNGDAFTTLKERLDARDENLLSRDVNAVDFGIVGDGIADDTEALQAASDHAASLGLDKVLFIPKGRYRTTKTVSFKNSLIADQAEIRYEGTGVAVVVGDESSKGIFTNRQKYRLPRVINRTRPSIGWDGTSIGIKTVNLNTCVLDVPFIQDFEKGLYMYGYSHGNSYNTVFLGALWDNHKNLEIDANDDGWSNQTLYVGGRLQHSMNKGAFENDPDAYQVKVGGNSVSSNNIFLNTSIEGYNLAEYRIFLNGSYNQFINPRLENHSKDNPKIYYASNSNYNKIIGGYHAQNLVEVFSDDITQGGTIDDGKTPFFKGTLTDSQNVDNTTDYKILKGLTTEQHRCKFDNNSGELFLKPGKWKITAKATFKASQGGTIQIRIIRGTGTVIASQVMRTDNQYQISINTDVVDTFVHDQPVRVELRQTSSNESLTLNRGHLTSLTAEYLGGK